MPKPKGRRWCRPLIGSQRFDVRVMSEEDCTELAGREAVTIYQDTLIAIRRGMSSERSEDCLAHESCGHAMLDATGLDHMIQERLGLTDAQYARFEEIIARSVVPNMLAVLKANGWLRMPRQPGRSRATGAASAGKRRRSRR